MTEEQAKKQDAKQEPVKKELTDEEKKMWLDKAKDFAGNQVKIVEVWH